MGGEIYAEFEQALTAVLTDLESRAELREALHRARALVDRKDARFAAALERAIGARHQAMERELNDLID